jgi:AcrR family transcriptional regulator
MSTKRLPAKERRKSILKAAERCVARKGYYSATTADIAAEAGVTEPVLYQHFKNKDDLMEKMRARTQEDINSYVARRALKQPTPLAGLREIAAATIDFTSRHRNKMRAQIFAIPNLETGGFREIVNQNIKILHNVFVKIMEEARNQGEISEEVDIPNLAWSYQAMVQLIYIGNALGLDLLFKDKEKYMDLIDRLLRNASDPADRGDSGDDQ